MWSIEYLYNPEQYKEKYEFILLVLLLFTNCWINENCSLLSEPNIDINQPQLNIIIRANLRRYRSFETTNSQSALKYWNPVHKQENIGNTRSVTFICSCRNRTKHNETKNTFNIAYRRPWIMGILGLFRLSLIRTLPGSSVSVQQVVNYH